MASPLSWPLARVAPLPCPLGTMMPSPLLFPGERGSESGGPVPRVTTVVMVVDGRVSICVRMRAWRALRSSMAGGAVVVAGGGRDDTAPVPAAAAPGGEGCGVGVLSTAISKLRC